MSVNERYDAFQREAVTNIVADFKEDPKGRYLLVIPTGGGKTTTAVKSVSGLYEAGILESSDKVMWVVHRDELRLQAEESFMRFSKLSNQPDLPGRVDVVMLSQVGNYLTNNPFIKLAVVDEAHHVAANSYQPLFNRPNLGILGLTATPSRHDGKPLQFSRESYSIGFPDLVSIGVLLRPNVIRVDGGSYDISDISNDSDTLEVFNNTERNNRILKILLAQTAKLQKVIIYAGTKQHARDLYQLLKSSPLAKSYDTISIILGGERRRYVTTTQSEVVDESRQDFIKAQKDLQRSILVNVDVLTEGYDDPIVNTVVMARPTNSKLVYMQALGRAVRIDPENAEKEAYVIEVEDHLPNITYRIDNRWLYSDISDLLEPDVTDVSYRDFVELNTHIVSSFEKFNVPPAHRVIPNYLARDRLTMLLFKFYVGNNKYEHIPLIITNDTRQAAAGFFNYLASNRKQQHGLDIEQVLRPVRTQVDHFEVLKESVTRKNMVQAMENAWELVINGPGADSELIKSGYPWISFVSFRLQMTEEALGADLLQFTEDMLNKDAVRANLRTGSISSDYFLVRFPLPLHGSWGVFMSPNEFDELRVSIEKLKEHISESDGLKQWHAAIAVLGTASVAIEQRHIQSLTTIVREDLDYFRPVG